ncbi:MAG: phosphoribosyltransferase domain-containing protein [Lachnospiraceae bacterium]|nr:phosphoribosyltransferase domain-containing protein [Lachnospiraceae bacterium]
MYSESDLVRIAKRENNTKRNYLVVNRLQGKHIPVKPSAAVEMFQELAEALKGAYVGENLLLVGFAETATAIGAAVAVELGTKYIQTTREIIPEAEYIFFSEEHSHATEQKLVKNDMDLCMKEMDRIVFVEDEVTTGKTILNIIGMLEKLYPGEVKYSVASLLNGMDDTALQLYADKGIRLHYLVKTNHDAYGVVAEQFAGDGTYVACDTGKPQFMVTELHMGGAMNARRLVDANGYKEACETLWGQLEGSLYKELSGKVLVLGTEEFMYPALYVARRLEEKGLEVYSHATTRSPIAVSSEQEYPLHVRYELCSLYDRERVTFLYDIDAYDVVFIITDARAEQQEGLNSLINAVRQRNNKIFCIRWC